MQLRVERARRAKGRERALGVPTQSIHEPSERLAFVLRVSPESGPLTRVSVWPRPLTSWRTRPRRRAEMRRPHDDEASHPGGGTAHGGVSLCRHCAEMVRDGAGNVPLPSALIPAPPISVPGKASSTVRVQPRVEREHRYVSNNCAR